MTAATAPAFTDADLVALPDLRRQQILVKAHPIDNAGKIVATYDPQFDLTRTIFKTLPSGIKQASAPDIVMPFLIRPALLCRAL